MGGFFYRLLGPLKAYMKHCNKCMQELPQEDFYKHKGQPDGLARTCKVCMKAYSKKYTQDGSRAVTTKTWRDKSRGTPAYRAYRLIQAAKDRLSDGFDLTAEWARERIEAGVCEVTGLPFDLSSTGHTPSPFAPSLDKTDPKLPYSQSNTKVVVWLYNRAKGPNGHDVVVTLAKAILSNGK